MLHLDTEHKTRSLPNRSGKGEAIPGVNVGRADFPSQTSALQSSVSSLSTTIQKLPSSPTPQQLAALVPKIDSTVTAAQGLQRATSSACD